MEDGGRVALLVPVKDFARAKARLAGVLDAPARNELARRMATRVVLAAGALPVSVVCDDDEVARWTEALGVRVIRVAAQGLDRAVADGVDALAAEGVARVIVAAGDLPLADGLAELAGGAGDGVTLVPDRRDDGTNVAVVPAGAGFRFAYGPGSFARHVAEGGRLELDVEVLRPAALTLDVDLPEDLALARSRLQGATWPLSGAQRSCA